MKNIYTIVGVVGIIIVSVIAYLIGIQTSSGGVSLWGGSTIMDYVPDTLGQILVLKPDDDLIQVAQATNTIDDESFGSLLSSVETIVVYQNTDNHEPLSLLFVKGGAGFDIQQLETLGVLASGPGYTARELGDDIYLYADQAGLDRYDTQDGSLSDLASAETFIDQINSGEYNAGFFSTPTGISQLGGYSALLAANLESTYLLSSLSLSQPSGQLIIQMLPETIPESLSSFQPVLSRWTDSSLLYVELQGVQDLLGVAPDQLQSLLILASSTGGIPLPPLDHITDLTSSNIALSVIPSATSPLGIQAGLIIDGRQHYKTLEALYPTLEALITTNLPLIASGSSLTTTQSDNTIVSGLQLGDETLPVMTLLSQDDTTQLVVFGDRMASGPVETSDQLPDDTIGVFGRDSSLATQILGTSLPGSEETGRLQGSIHADSETDQIRIEFVQENI